MSIKKEIREKVGCDRREKEEREDDPFHDRS